MKGCLSVIGVLVLLVLLFTFPLFTIGLAITLWGLSQFQEYRKEGTSLKKPSIILSIGIIFLVISLATGTEDRDVTEDESNEQAPTDEREEQEDTGDSKDEEKESVPDSEEDTPEEETEEPDENTPDQTGDNDPDSSDEASDPDVVKDEVATITDVVDGDTVKVNINGTEESIRLLLVDTPETNHPSLPIQPFGPEATDFAEETLSGEEVAIEYDGPKRDKYDRLLAYIWVDGELFNGMLIEEGLARYAYEYDPPYTHQETLQALEENAREAERGIWSIDGYVQDDGFGTSQSSSSPSSGSSGSTPASSSSTNDSSSDTIHYENCTAVREANADPIHRGDPGYASHLDRDGDGIGCE
ncbi:thermonuclease family protein [Alteribacillus iranensis]|uniref:thermonuclease family protein n=1 Tax=Alteribacillus iranensis TaxID=930128 RepID=UPI001FE0AEF5|nr:thermonuclease family protein [Alteribacillus iranensis]